MPACEKCWSDSRRSDIDGTGPTYDELLERRTCTPEEQAGPDAGGCPKCNRKTLHQVCDVCMNPECQFDARDARGSGVK